MNNTFKHSGDIGDIIYGLVSIKRIGGGTLYLDTSGGENDKACNFQCLDGKTKFNKVSIFLNVFNVHVNRVPLPGVVTKVIYRPGKFLSANAEDASVENERNSVVVKNSNGTEIIFVQVAGLVARRIISDLKEGQEVVAGQRYGIIRFGSRADLYFPENVEIKSLLGQTMVGGETIIAKIN